MICSKCQQDKPDVKKRRQRTACVDDEQNFGTFCGECQKEEDEYWDEKWKEYYSSLL